MQPAVKAALTAFARLSVRVKVEVTQFSPLLMGVLAILKLGVAVLIVASNVWVTVVTTTVATVAVTMTMTMMTVAISIVSTILVMSAVASMLDSALFLHRNFLLRPILVVIIERAAFIVVVIVAVVLVTLRSAVSISLVVGVFSFEFKSELVSEGANLAEPMAKAKSSKDFLSDFLVQSTMFVTVAMSVTTITSDVQATKIKGVAVLMSMRSIRLLRFLGSVWAEWFLRSEWIVRLLRSIWA